MSIPNGKNVYGYADAYAKLANFGQQHLLKYYDELDEAQRAALLNQIEQIDFSVVSTNKQPEKRVAFHIGRNQTFESTLIV